MLVPNLLEGEMVTGQAHGVARFHAYGNNSTGELGSLLCTNFKLSFVTAFPDLEDEVSFFSV